ncbi:hypothetical protein GVv1_30470 [Enterobacter pseudoroggenkampii]
MIENINSQCSVLYIGVIESIRTQNANQNAHKSSTTSIESVMILLIGLGKDIKKFSILKTGRLVKACIQFIK